jgi:hypothetical protein
MQFQNMYVFLREARLVLDGHVGRERLFTVNPVPLQSAAVFWQASLSQ